jgi:hypothetical protein
MVPLHAEYGFRQKHRNHLKSRTRFGFSLIGKLLLLLERGTANLPLTYYIFTTVQRSGSVNWKRD